MNKKWRDGRTREGRAIRAFVKQLTQEAAKELKKKEDYVESVLVFSLKENGEEAGDSSFLSWLGSNDKKAEKEFFRQERWSDAANRIMREAEERMEREV